MPPRKYGLCRERCLGRSLLIGFFRLCEPEKVDASLGDVRANRYLHAERCKVEPNPSEGTVEGGVEFDDPLLIGTAVVFSWRLRPWVRILTPSRGPECGMRRFSISWLYSLLALFLPVAASVNLCPAPAALLQTLCLRPFVDFGHYTLYTSLGYQSFCFGIILIQ